MWLAAARTWIYRHCPVFVLFLILTVVLQWAGGAYQAEFSSDSDEPAHYVTGLMVKTYVTGALGDPTMRYAQEYYLHYPKVGLGHWPPFFYVVQTAWGIPFGHSRPSMLLLIAVITALAAAGVVNSLRQDFSTAASLAGGLILVTLPHVAQLSRAVMTEMLMMFLILRASLALARFFDQGRTIDSVRFGLWASLAILSKGTGIILAFLPAVMIFLLRRWRWVLKPSLWLSAVIVALLCTPWYFSAPGARHEAVGEYGQPAFAHWRLRPPPVAFFPAFNEVVSTAATLGLLVILYQLWRRRYNDLVPNPNTLILRRDVLIPSRDAPIPSRDREGAVTGQHTKWVVFASLALTLMFVRLAFLVWEIRHMVELAPAFVMLAAAGLAWLGAWKPLQGRPGVALLAIGVVAVSAFHIWRTPPKTRHGAREVARDLLTKPEMKAGVILAVADALGEGLLISEIAMQEPRPERIVLRGTKMLSSSRWLGENYSLLVRSPEEVDELLAKLSVDLLVLDLAPGRKQPHIELMQKVALLMKDRWTLLAQYPDFRPSRKGNDRFAVYRLRGTSTHEARAASEKLIRRALFGRRAATPEP